MAKASEITVEITREPDVPPDKAAEAVAKAKQQAADEAEKAARAEGLQGDAKLAAEAAAANTRNEAAAAGTAAALAAAKQAAADAQTKAAVAEAAAKAQDAKIAAEAAVNEAAAKEKVLADATTAAATAIEDRAAAVTAASAEGVTPEDKLAQQEKIDEADSLLAMLAAATAGKKDADAEVIAAQAKAEDAALALTAAEASTSLPTYTVTVTDSAGGSDGGSAYTRKYTSLTIAPGPKYLVAVMNADPSRLVDVKELGGALTTGERKLALTEPKGLSLAPILPPDLAAVPAEGPEDLKGDAVRRTGLLGLDGVDEITMVCVPDLMAIQPTNPQIRDVHAKVDEFCSTGPIKRMAILDPPPGLTKADIQEWRADPSTPSSNFAVLYWPWLEVMDPFTSKPMLVPPCGHMAGVWAGTDNDRGVHKAPANVAVKAAIGVAAEITDGDQDVLNPTGVNCIRTFPGSGIRVWGARTLSSDPEWRYINVRRLFNYVTASILKGTQWAVFEPNDEFLWSTLRVGIGNFLLGMWRQGAFFGATPAEAYFVKCDHETNPQDLIDAGQVNMHIGIAPVKPAEFVIFQIAQYTAQA